MLRNTLRCKACRHTRADQDRTDQDLADESFTKTSDADECLTAAGVAGVGSCLELYSGISSICFLLNNARVRVGRLFKLFIILQWGAEV